MERLTIIQHNICTWHNKRLNLSNVYRQIDPDIILLNHTGIPTEPIHLRGYKIYSSNVQEQHSRGTALAIKSKIEHRMIDDVDDDLLAVEVSTRTGPIIIITDYLSPSADYINYHDYYRFMK